MWEYILLLFVIYWLWQSIEAFGFTDMGECPKKCGQNPYAYVKPINADNKFDPPMVKNMLVRNCDGTVRIDQVPINSPFEEITNIYGHGGQTYDFKEDYQSPYPGFPSKREIDAYASNYFIPRMCVTSNCERDLEPRPSDPIHFINRPIL